MLRHLWRWLRGRERPPRQDTAPATTGAPSRTVEAKAPTEGEGRPDISDATVLPAHRGPSEVRSDLSAGGGAPAMDSTALEASTGARRLEGRDGLAGTTPLKPMRRVRVIVVGLDYGTSSTKVLIRPRGETDARLLRLEEHTAPGYPSLVSPSLVALDSQDRCWFGSMATEQAGARVFRSLKVRLLGPGSGLGKATRAPTHDETDLLVVGYLAWTLNMIRQRLSAAYAGDQVQIALNVAAPMNHVGVESLRLRYLRILQAAWQAVYGPSPIDVGQGLELADLRTWSAPWLSEQVVVEPRATRRFEVLPETLAPLVSLARDPRMAPGRYLMVDVGAGTTEMSINSIRETGADQRILCYHDDSAVVGVDDFNAGRPVLGPLGKMMQVVWDKGYRKECGRYKLREAWRELTVLVAGGGCLRPDVLGVLEKSNPLNRWGTDKDVRFQVRPHTPTGVLAPDNPREEVRGLQRLLSVAHGLSIPRQEWPRFFPPGQVGLIPRDKPPDQPPPYWYLD